MSKAIQPDGGKNALAGFLYQIVGVLGLRAMACIPSTTSEDELNAPVSVVSEGRLEHERFGSDAVLSVAFGNGEGLSLIQFKFSRSVPPRRIGPSEFREIADKLAVSKGQAEGAGQSVAGLLLITNRPVTHDEGKPRSRSQRQSVRVISDVPMTTWLGTLTRFAKDFGCHDLEIDQGIDRLIGSIQRRTVGEAPAAVETPDLIEAFTGSNKARPLTSERLKPVCDRQISSFSADLVVPQDRAVRREVLDRLEDETIRSALVILEGTGGNGKSTTLATWARAALDTPSPRPGALVWVSPASDIQPCWIREVVCDCAEIEALGHVRRSEGIEAAIDRLAVANPLCPRPVLLLGLDGLDEGAEFAERRKAIKETLGWFWREDERARREAEPPIATLVVTCRESQEVVDEWINSTVSGFRSETRRPQTLKVGDFSDRELLEAVRLGAPKLYELFESTVNANNPLSLGPYDDVPPAADLTRGAGPLIGGDTLESLRHPAVWRAFLELPRETRDRVLAGDPAATRKFAEVFTDWFCRKARRRKLKERSCEDLLHVLTAVSTRSGEPGAKDYRTGWEEPAFESGVMGKHEILVLYSEAVSAGYVARDSQTRWRWRHLMCPDYLTSLWASDGG